MLGGGVIVGIAALLWAAYFLPLWVRRRQFAATEQNAIRIQRTLRVLAETTEVPHEVRVEATARHAAAQERILRSEQAKQEAQRNHKISRAEAEATLARRQAEAAAAEAERVAQMKSSRLAREAQVEAKKMAQQQKSTARNEKIVARRKEAATAGAVARARKARARRVRASVSLILLAGVITFVAGIVGAIAGGSIVALIVGSIVVAVSLVALKLVAPQRQVAHRVAPAVVHAFEMDEASAVAEEQVQDEDRSWTPRELPKPLYLTRQAPIQRSQSSEDAQERLLRAAALSEEVRRAAERAAQIPNISTRRASADSVGSAGEDAVGSAIAGTFFDMEPTVPTRASRPRQQAPQRASGTNVPDASRLRSMGVVEDAEQGLTNLDDVLRRRRNVG